MPEDPFAALEAAVVAVEQTAATLIQQRDTLDATLEAPRPVTIDAASSPDGTKREAAETTDRLALLEEERRAVRDRLLRVRDRLAAVSITVPEAPSS